jgi:ATP-dependent DNA helicase RecG
LRDRKLLELAKVEAARFANPPSEAMEATEAERKLVWSRLKDAWQRRYGLVEAG